MSELEAVPAYVFYPYLWQQAIWQHLTQLADNQRLPHAVLFSGHAGIGKQRLARAFAARLLCAAPRAECACGACKSCELLKAGTHPDMVWLAPEVDAKTGKVAKNIKVDQVRELVGFSEKSAQMGGYRVVVIEPAHLLNVQAANALLKTLEEPGRDTVIMLLSSQPLSLSATIRSRCQQAAFGIPAAADAQAWLAPQVQGEASARLLLDLCAGAPLAALALHDAPWFAERERLLRDLAALCDKQQTALAVAQRWHALGAEVVLHAVASLVEDIAVAASGSALVKHHDLAPIIAAIARRVRPSAVLDFRQSLIEKQRLLSGNVQANAVLDAVFSEWAKIALRP